MKNTQNTSFKALFNFEGASLLQDIHHIEIKAKPVMKSDELKVLDIMGYGMISNIFWRSVH